MPYRRLPNTDNARMNALQTALSLGKELPPFKLAFSQSSLQKILSFLPGFNQVLVIKKQTFSYQVEKNKEYQKTLKKARLYISHFIQVLNLAIIRGELPPSTRSYYKINERDKTLPSLTSESEVIACGERLIQGEAERIAKGLTPITNPTIAVVKVRYEQFLDAYNFQKTLQKKNNRSLENLALKRAEADKIILQIWNEVEESYKDLPEDMKRERAKEYGLVYVYRKNELRNINYFSASQKGIG